ncbi:hypothetical protein R3X27_22675 [Tropicimonas sp. TH_r6]|uniref:hypothetical protein n=1 Tax=Tropicimonas sp. TH_r6 TaxID=3082085 RepID=UPI002954400A|nr:hypothetical protein [Tropicimonas sp. TH_r6]MDV7145500.1 hypothetical protein [Tropicimonas sp. TH_r6]
MAALLATLGACSEGEEVAREDLPFEPVYRGIDTRLLDGDLVGFIVEMEGARDAEDVEDYARCAAAQYTLIRGYGFARHVRTRVAQESGVWRADAVYTVSPALPQGLQTIDATVAVEDCAARGIPTV